MPRTTGKPKHLPIALLAVAILVLLAHNVLWPWTPYWAEILLGIVVLVLWLSQNALNERFSRQMTKTKSYSLLFVHHSNIPFKARPLTVHVGPNYNHV